MRVPISFLLIIALIVVLGCAKNDDNLNLTFQLDQNEDRQIPKKDRGTKEQILANFKNLEHGRFVQTSDYEGYIEYEVEPGQKSGFQMIMDETGIWKVSFTPIQ